MPKLPTDPPMRTPGYYAKLDGKDKRYAEATILTDKPWPDGTIVGLNGVDFYPLIHDGLVFDGRNGGIPERLDSIVGRPKSIKYVTTPDKHRGVALVFSWLDKDRFKPGRYGIGLNGGILKRDGNMIVRLRAMSVTITKYDEERDGYCYLDIEEGDEG